MLFFPKEMFTLYSSNRAQNTSNKQQLNSNQGISRSDIKASLCGCEDDLGRVNLHLSFSHVFRQLVF